MDSSIFKAYDIRGVYPIQIDADSAYKIAQAYAKLIQPKTVALGRDVRISGPELWDAARRGLMDHGVDVIDIGVISTDMLYFAVANYGYDGGITISASHNPKEYNGMKMVRSGAVPISGDTGIKEMRDLVDGGYEYKADLPGELKRLDIQQEYLDKCLTFIDLGKIKPMRVVVNGMFGPAVKNLRKMNLPIGLIAINENLDGTFPKGQPDPLQEQNRAETIELIQKEKPNFGAAWDADADRFFLFDEKGRFIPGYYLTAFLIKHIVSAHAGSKVISDARLTWANMEKANKYGGVYMQNKAGHSFIKERMREEDAIFAGEMSGHYYFRDYFYCDNGLIPFLMILQIASESDLPVSGLFDSYFFRYPISGELNTPLESRHKADLILTAIEQKYADARIERIDGLSIEYETWRANIRSSNTEPLLRLNVEAKDDGTLKKQTEELLKLIQN